MWAATAAELDYVAQNWPTGEKEWGLSRGRALDELADAWVHLLG